MAKDKYNLREELLKSDEIYRNDVSVLGKGMLTVPQYNNSMRSVMFASHMNQFKNQLHPDFPQFFTGGENVVGEHSDGYKRLNKSHVYRKIVKFEGLVENPTVYKLFIYNETKKRYEVIDRKPQEDLVEVFGYKYDNSVIDSFDEGDDIDEGTIAYKSTSYDDDMNYSYGRDLVAMYSLDPFTSEDACIISDEARDKLDVLESEINVVTLNDNDYPLNLYGDHEHGEYKTFPDIGEKSNGIIMATRRKFNNQILFDFKADMLCRATDTDTKYYLNGEVVDIDIFCNNEELKDNSFYHQIYTYWCYQNAYYRQIKQTCEEIFESGEDFSNDVDYSYKRACEMLDLEMKWKEKDSAFSNVQIHMLVARETKPSVGQKVSPRHGNKSVISDIRPVEDMPYYYEDGKKVHVDIIYNLLGIINRTTAGPIIEMATNFIGKRISLAMRKLKTQKEKEKILFDVINTFSIDEFEYLKGIYKNLDKVGKKEFLTYCETKKIHLHQPSTGEKSPVFYRLMELKEKYSDILAPDEVYINKFGREIKCLNDAYIANMYVFVLKQTAKKGFSVRGIGAVSNKGIPERSYKSKSHKDLYSSTAIRFGEFETLNFTIAMMPEEVALIHALYRTSVKARRDLGKALLKNEPVISVSKKYDSRVAEFFEIILKSLGFSMEFLDGDDDLSELNSTDLEWFELNHGKSIICSEYDKFIIDRRQEIADEILEEYGMLNIKELNEMIDEEIKDREYIIGNEWDDSKELYANCVEIPAMIIQPVSQEEIEYQLSEDLSEVEVSLD